MTNAEILITDEMMSEAYRIGGVQEVIEVLGEDVVYQVLRVVQSGASRADTQVAVEELLREPLKRTGFNRAVGSVANTIIIGYTESINKSAWDKGIAEWLERQGK